jgi:hypothetical protein
LPFGALGERITAPREFAALGVGILMPRRIGPVRVPRGEPCEFEDNRTLRSPISYRPVGLWPPSFVTAQTHHVPYAAPHGSRPSETKRLLDVPVRQLRSLGRAFSALAEIPRAKRATGRSKGFTKEKIAATWFAVVGSTRGGRACFDRLLENSHGLFVIERTTPSVRDLHRAVTDLATRHAAAINERATAINDDVVRAPLAVHWQ